MEQKVLQVGVLPKPILEIDSIIVDVNIPGKQKWKHRIGFAWRILVGVPISVNLPKASITIKGTDPRGAAHLSKKEASAECSCGYCNYLRSKS